MKQRSITFLTAIAIISVILAVPVAANAVVNWTKDTANNPMFQGGSAGSWDLSVERPAIIKDGGSYYMWYTGSESGTTDYIRIGYAASIAGGPWVKYDNPATTEPLYAESDPVLMPSASDWDSVAVGYCWVIRAGDNDYRMWYSGTNDPTTDTGWQIGYATSLDGITWAKQGALSSLTGGSNDWDGEGVGGPFVMYDPAVNKFKMWYYGWNSSFPSPGQGFGYAESDDGINWVKYNNPNTNVNPFANSDPVLRPGNPGSWDAHELGIPVVFKEGGVYRMWYSANPADETPGGIGYAYSYDGINWIKYDGNPILSKGNPGDFDQDNLYDPIAFNDGDVYLMAYVGVKCSGAGPDSCVSSIGSAESPTYSGPNPMLNDVNVFALNTSTGKSINFSLAPEGPGPLDVNELYVTGPGVFFIFRDANINNIVGMQIVGGGIPNVADFAPYAGDYTFTITANNGETASTVLNFSSPATIPYPEDDLNGFQRYIELGGTDYDTDNAYISGTTPTLKWSPMSGYENYYYRVRVRDLKGLRVWFQSDLILGTGGLMSATVPQGMLQPNTPYQYEIEALDTDQPWSAHNRSRSTAWKFYTGTKGTDFLANPYVFHMQSFRAGDQAVFGVNVYNLAPWDIDSVTTPFRVESSGVSPYYFQFSGASNYQDLGYYQFTPADYNRGLVGQPDPVTYDFIISDGSTSDTISRPFIDNPTVPQVTRETMSPQDNSYLSTLEPILSWQSFAGTSFKYRARVHSWNNFPVWVSGWTTGTSSPYTMSVTVPSNKLLSGPYRWFVEVQDTGNNTRTRSQYLTFLASEGGGSTTISGTVYESDGSTPLMGVNLRVVAYTGNPCGQIWEAGSGYIDTNGNYTISDLPPGTYYLRSDHMNQSNYVIEWWDDDPGSTPYCGNAQAIVLNAGQTVDGKDFQLDLGGSLSGQVIGDYGPVEGLFVQVFSGGCWSGWLGVGITDENGNYFVERLPPIPVYVVAQAEINHFNYLTEWFNDSMDCRLANTVNVVSATNQPDIDFVLNRGPKRVRSYEVVVGNGNLNPFFMVEPAFRDEVVSATLALPNTNRPEYPVYAFNLTNDKIEWDSECRYVNGWQKNFGAVDPADYGSYILNVQFQDGAQETYTYTIQDVTITPVSGISVTVNNDGSALVTWNRNTTLDHYYEVRVRDLSGQEIFKSQTFRNISQLSLSANDLRCLEILGNYRWLVRVYDNVYPLYSKHNTQFVEALYAPLSLNNRVTSASVFKWNGQLAVQFDVRSGSRGHVKAASVTGPVGSGFFYSFDIANDFMDSSTETRTNKAWFKTDAAWPLTDGTYTFTVDYDDDGNLETDYTEVVNRSLSADTFSPIANSSLEALIYADGAINFMWGLSGVSGLKYQVRIRSLDGLEEYYSSGQFTDGTGVIANFSDLRAMERGQTYQWFVRVWSADGDTMLQSASQQFYYDPAPVYDATAATFGTNSATITHQYMPFKVGDKLIYTGTGWLNGYGRYWEALATEVIDGVNCLKLAIRGDGHDPDPDNDPVFDVWAAQDTDGNIWLLQVDEYEGESLETLFSGRDQAVLWLPATPVVGQIFRQMMDEYTQLQKTGLEVTLGTMLGPYQNCLRLVWNDIGDLNFEYLAPGVGLVKEEWNDFEGTSGWELVQEIRAGGFDELAADFGSGGLYHYAGGTWARLSKSDPEDMCALGNALYVDLGPSGLYRFAGGVWTKVSGSNPEGMVAVGSDLYIDFGSTLGLYKYNGTTLTRVNKTSPEGMCAVGNALYADFGSTGLYRYSAGAWAKVSGSNPEGMVAVGSDLYIDFGSALGLYKYNGTTLTRVNKTSPEGMCAVGDVLYADFGSVGLYRYNAGAWAKVSGSDPEGMVAVGSDLYIDFGSALGLYKYNGTALTRVSKTDAEGLCAVGSDLYADFGAIGLYRYSGGVWTRASISNVESMTGVNLQ